MSSSTCIDVLNQSRSQQDEPSLDWSSAFVDGAEFLRHVCTLPFSLASRAIRRFGSVRTWRDQSNGERHLTSHLCNLPGFNVSTHEKLTPSGDHLSVHQPGVASLPHQWITRPSERLNPCAAKLVLIRVLHASYQPQNAFRDKGPFLRPQEKGKATARERDNGRKRKGQRELSPALQKGRGCSSLKTANDQRASTRASTWWRPESCGTPLPSPRGSILS